MFIIIYYNLIPDLTQYEYNKKRGGRFIRLPVKCGILESLDSPELRLLDGCTIPMEHISLSSNCHILTVYRDRETIAT